MKKKTESCKYIAFAYDGQHTIPRNYEQYFTDYYTLELESHKNPLLHITLEILSIQNNKEITFHNNLLITCCKLWFLANLLKTHFAKSYNPCKGSIGGKVQT
jgi:hypothetical protein